METLLCPKGHTSAEEDYCSECGAKMAEQLPPATGTAALPGNMPGEICPECGAPHEQHDAVFCDVCGYNFVTGAHGGEVVPAAPGAAILLPAPAEPAPGLEPLPAVAPATPLATWTLLVTVDPTLRDPQSPEAPSGIGPFTFALSTPSSLIGRRSEARAIFPEIPLSYDDAVSHRHALLQLDPAGTLTLRDIGATNGTRLNGKDVTPMVDVPLNDGDQITLGHWSRITVHASK
jgi:hypothetical protein